MNDALLKELVEASWRRRLTPAEEVQLQSYLAVHPEQQGQWEDEAGLNDFLRQLPEAPLASNFTAQVLQTVEREAHSQEAERGHLADVLRSVRDRTHALLHGFAVKLAATALALVCSLLAFQQYQAYNQKLVTQKMFSTIGEVASALPAPEILQDFDTINQLRTTATPSDEDLLAVLEK